MIYFTADTHFGHRHFLNYTNRPFHSVEEMTEYIIESINNTVNTHDVLYFIGDFCGRSANPIFYANKIKCKNIHLILGNHDIEKRCGDYFTSVDKYKEIQYNDQTIVMSHYPMRRWHNDYKGSWMLYGHVHGFLNKEDINNDQKTLDVGVDNFRYNIRFGTPWSFNDIENLFKEKNRPKNLCVDRQDKMLYTIRNRIEDREIDKNG